MILPTRSRTRNFHIRDDDVIVSKAECCLIPAEEPCSSANRRNRTASHPERQLEKFKEEKNNQGERHKKPHLKQCVPRK